MKITIMTRLKFFDFFRNKCKGWSILFEVRHYDNCYLCSKNRSKQMLVQSNLKVIFRPIFRSLFFLFFLFALSTEANAVKKVKTIAVFFSMDANLPAYTNMLEGIRSSLSEGSAEPYNLLTEYLDIGRSKDEEHARHLVELYNEKFQNNKPDLLITVGPFTYSLLTKFGLEALKNTPSINLESDPLVVNTPAPLPNPYGIFINVKFRISETLKHAFELFPKYREVYVITGNSNTDFYITGLLKKSAADFKSTHHFTFINGITLDSMLLVVGKIPAKSIVIIPMYLADKNNVPYSTPEAIRIIAENCNAPVFPILDSFLKTNGGIGGFLFSYIFAGKETGRIAREIFDGKPLRDIIVNKESFYQYMYDWKQLKKWHLLDSKSIPSESLVFNREYGFFAEYKWYILAGILFMILETFLMAYLIKLIIRQKAIGKQKSEAEELYRMLVREERMMRMVELTASLSHELNQPLTAILYSAQAGDRFLESGKLDYNQAKEIFRNIIEDDKRAAALISSVKSLMKLENRTKENVNISSLIHETLYIFHSEAIKQNIEVNHEQVNMPVFIFGDKIQIQQVILNFLFNASLSMEIKDPGHRLLVISQKLSKGKVIVSVRDSGPGIDDAVKDKLFKAFVTTRSSGFGIGLAVSRSIIEKHNGTIWAENHPEGGAEFSFSLETINHA